MSASIQEQLLAAVAQHSRDPLAYAQGAYRWGKPGPLQKAQGPRAWQRDILAAIRDHLNGPSRFLPLKIAVAAGNGIGKSALIGMVTDWALSTCGDSRVMLTAGKGEQLDSKTIPEVGRWVRAGITSDWWEVLGRSIRAKQPGHDKTWRADFVTWSEENPDAFSGLHNQGRRIVIVFDEASAIADVIWDVTEGALTDQDTEIIWIAFGNPLRSTGRFAECFGIRKHRWVTRQIDSRTVEGVNLEFLKQQVADFGEDHDWVRVHIRGEFPASGDLQFIPRDIVAAARKYRSQGHERMPKILAADIARFGDDQTVIGYRQGRRAVILQKYRGVDTMQTAARISQEIENEAPDAVVVDADGLGAGVVDRLKQLGYGAKVTEFHGGGEPYDKAKYFNRRSECYSELRNQLKNGMEIPDLPELESELTGPEYYITEKGQIQLESKADMKKRGLSSPDLADMLMMTFAVQVARPKPPNHGNTYAWSGQAGSWMG